MDEELQLIYKQASAAGELAALEEFAKSALDYRRLADLLDSANAVAPKPGVKPRPKPGGKPKPKGQGPKPKPKPKPDADPIGLPDSPKELEDKLKDLLPKPSPELKALLHPGLSLPAAFGGGMLLDNVLNKSDD